MVKVVLLDKLYDKSAPYITSPVDELNKLRGIIRGNQLLRSTIDSQLPAFGFKRDSSIESILEQQVVRGYASGKGQIVTYPEGPRRLPSDFSLIFPYNIDPTLSIATLVALKEDYKTQLPLETNEERVVKEAVDYLLSTTPNWGDPRNEGIIEAHRAARRFLGAYERLKNHFINSTSKDLASFVLMLSFTATYQRLRRMSEMHADFERSFPYASELFTELEKVEIDPNEILGHFNGKPVKRYIKPEDLPKERTKRFIDFLKAELTQEAK